MTHVGVGVGVIILPSNALQPIVWKHFEAGPADLAPGMLGGHTDVRNFFTVLNFKKKIKYFFGHEWSSLGKLIYNISLEDLAPGMLGGHTAVHKVVTVLYFNGRPNKQHGN